MLHFALTHPLLVRVVLALGGLLLAVAIAAAALRQPRGYRPRHGRRATAVNAEHTPRHALVYEGRHEHASRGPVQLGHDVDGSLALIHADPPAEPAHTVRLADEPTVDGVRALVGASA